MKTTLVFLTALLSFAAAEYGRQGYTPGYILRNYFERQQFSKGLENQAFGGYGYGLGGGLGGGYGLVGGLGYGYGGAVGGLGGYGGYGYGASGYGGYGYKKPCE